MKKKTIEKIRKKVDQLLKTLKEKTTLNCVASEKCQINFERKEI